MSTFTSKFVGLPKASELRALAYPDGMPDSFPFERPDVHVSSFEKQYLTEVARCIREGVAKSSRPGQNTLMLDDVQFVIDISGHQIPALSTKYVPYNSYKVEDLWFVSGSTDVAYLKANNVPIWDEWVIPETAVFEFCELYSANDMLTWVRCIAGMELYKSWRDFQRDNGIGRPTVEQVLQWWGTTGREDQIPKVELVSGSIGEGAYGAMWRARKAIEKTDDHVEFFKRNPDWNIVDGIVSESGTYVEKTFDQLGDVIKALRTGADSRRILLDAWDPAKVKDCALPPCHPWVQFLSHVDEATGKRHLTVKVTMRSNDAMLGNPFNCGQYALLGHMVAHVTGHLCTKLVLAPGDFHIYEDQLPMVPEQLSRVPRPVGAYVTFNPEVKEIDDFHLDDIIIEGYKKENCHPMINYPVAV